ncbi:MAG: SpoVR family protein [Gammaproteobacteria bacterium]|jgi:stage V sporulation protein R|nr:SpoVR family protein [Gammaproteobacteria bacterium]
MERTLEHYLPKIEALARESGLVYFPVDYEQVPDSFMMEVAVYGLPVRMPHWSFGVRYIYQFVQHRMGHSRLFEVVFPGDPGRAYLSRNNSVAENVLVAAHVLGHADFSRNNLLFEAAQRSVGYHIVEQAAVHAREISRAIERHGIDRVEAVLDAALSLEQYIAVDRDLTRQPYPEYVEEKTEPASSPFRSRYDRLPGGGRSRGGVAEPKRSPIPPHPEHDLLWFVANYAPEMEPWERDVFLAVREESFYFYPVFACQIMNEGWASYWHARLLREADFLPQQMYLEAVKAHSDVVRPYAAGQEVSLKINPYHLGFFIWEDIVESGGLEAARKVMRENDDFGFIRNHLEESLARKLDLFTWEARRSGEVRAKAFDIDAIREFVLSGKFNFGAPRVHVAEMRADGTLVLVHEHATDGRGLDRQSAEKVMDYLLRVWRRTVELRTVDAKGGPSRIVRQPKG